MTKLRLSRAAAEDLERIAQDGAERFGPEPAADYVASFQSSFSLLQTYPHAGREREDIRPGLRSRPHRSHVIFYDVTGSTLTIVRVLHGAMDVGGTIG